MRAAAAALAGAFAFAAVAAGGVPSASIRYLQAREQEGGGFAEANGRPSLSLTAWVVLGLRAARAPTGARTRAYLEREEPTTTSELELALMARAVTGLDTGGLVERLEGLRHTSGVIGPTLNTTFWGVLALRQAGRPVPFNTGRLLLRRQASSGGWSWSAGVAPDSNDTAAAVQALRALGVRGRPIRRGLAYLRRLQNADGGFELVTGRGSDAQSTAWVVQAFRAAGRPAPSGALPYLRRLRRPDGSYRYSTRYDATPVWVTAQVLPALAGKPFPLR